MKWYLVLIPLLLILTAGCVGEERQVQTPDPYAGVWIHDSGDPVFIFEFNPGGLAYIWFMALEDSERQGHPVMKIGGWQESPDGLDIAYNAPLSGENRILHLTSDGDGLLLIAASRDDGTGVEIDDLAGIRFVRGESYTAPLMNHQPITIV